MNLCDYVSYVMVKQITLPFADQLYILYTRIALDPEGGHQSIKLIDFP